MRKITTALLLLTLLLGACSSGSPATETAPPQPSATTTDAATNDSVATEALATETTVPAREAKIIEIENTVSARMSAEAELTPASAGMLIGAGGGVETGSDGRARIDLLPDGTIVRVGPNSSFNMPELIEVDGEPKTTIELFFGKVYILLNGGSLEVKTPTGVASVRGSVLSVQYSPTSKRIEASCLEGHCALEDEEGVEVELEEGEESYLDFGEDPTEPEPIDSAEIQDWLDEVPEVPDFFDDLPNPEDFPEPDEEDGFLDDDGFMDEDPPPAIEDGPLNDNNEDLPPLNDPRDDNPPSNDDDPPDPPDPPGD